MKKIGCYFISLMGLMSCTSLLASPLPVAQCADMQVQTLGAGGPEINDGLASSSFLVWINGKARIMVDAGEEVRLILKSRRLILMIYKRSY